MRILFLVGLIFYSTNGFCQIFEDMEIDDSGISGWIEENPENYEGIYFFGISEYESTVTLAIEKECVDFQVMNHDEFYLDDGTFGGWNPKFTNYTNVRISGNKFYSSESNGEFVIFKTKKGESFKCLKLEEPPIDVYDNQYELGQKSDKNNEEFLEGNFVKTKFEIIPKSELLKMSLFDLRIMRNEIFARYGYIFKPEGEMNMYFSKQDWYNPKNIEVKDQITCIEKINIENILQLEK